MKREEEKKRRYLERMSLMSKKEKQVKPESNKIKAEQIESEEEAIDEQIETTE